MTLSLSTKMVRLAEDRAMFKIARFEKQFRQASVTQPTHPSHRRSRHLLFTSDQPASKACTVSKSQQSGGGSSAGTSALSRKVTPRNKTRQASTTQFQRARKVHRIRQ